MSAPSTLQWFKSSYSGGSGTECVECARTETRAFIRDSKQACGSAVVVATRAWSTFIRALERGVM